MAAPKTKNKIQKEVHLAAVERFYLQCRPQHEIAATLGVSMRQVRYDLATLRKRWAASHEEGAIEKKRAAEVAKIDQVEAEAWEAWERSKEDAEIRTQKVRAAEAGGEHRPIEATVRTEGQSGDVAYLNTVLKCIEGRRKMFGLDAPEKHEVKGGISVTHRLGFPEMTDDELMHLIAAARNAVTRTGGNGNAAPPARQAVLDSIYNISDAEISDGPAPQTDSGALGES